MFSRKSLLGILSCDIFCSISANTNICISICDISIATITNTMTCCMRGTCHWRSEINLFANKTCITRINTEFLTFWMETIVAIFETVKFLFIMNCNMKKISCMTIISWIWIEICIDIIQSQNTGETTRFTNVFLRDNLCYTRCTRVDELIYKII